MKQTKRYSEMSPYELRQEIASLNEQAQKAEQLGIVNQFAVLERKAEMAQSYLLNPEDYPQGSIFEIKSDPGVLFKVTKIDGVMAWGHRLTEKQVDEDEEVALPISLLIKGDS